jgi:O-antigen ligase
MLEALAAISLLVWVPLVAQHMVQRGFLVLLIWLLIAPPVTNLISGRGNPLFPPPPDDEEQELTQPRAKTRKEGAAYMRVETTIRAAELLEPNRLLFGMFFLLYMVRSLLHTKRFPSFDRSETWMALFSIVLLANVVLFSIRVAFSARIAVDSFIVPFLGYFVGRKLVWDEARFSQLTRFLAYFGCCLILLGLIEFLLHGSSHRVQGPFRTRDYLYVAMVVIFFMVAIDVLRHRFNRQRSGLLWWIQIFVLGGSPLIIVLTLTRGNWVGFLAGLWVFAFFSRKLLTRRQKLAGFGLAVGLIPILLLGAMEVAQIDTVSSRVTNVRTIETRLATYARLLDVLAKNPVFGIGLNNARNHLYESWQRGETLGTPHNSYLGIAAELGAPALLLYLAVMCSICWTGYRIYRNEKTLPDRWRGAALMAMMMAYLVANMFSHLAYAAALLHLYLFVCAGAVAGRYGSPLRRAVRVREPVRMRQPLSSQL